MGDFINKDGGWLYSRASNANGEKQNKMTPQETAWDLRKLKFEFREKAAYYGRMATAVSAALELIEEAEKLKTEAAQRQQQEKKAQTPAISKLTAAYEATGDQKPGDQFYFLVDGSQSMLGRTITEALNAVAGVQTAAAKAFPVKAMMWNEEQIKPLDNLSDPKVRESLSKDLGVGSDMALLFATMDAIASSSPAPKHFIIVSDSDIYEEKQAKTSLGKLLGENSNVSVDFVILRDKGMFSGKTPMREPADSLQRVFPAQVQAVTVDLSAGNVPDAFTGLVQGHLKSSAAGPAATKKLPAAPAPK